MADKLISKYFSQEDLANVSKAISENEKKTSGEIRVVISEKRSFFARNKSIRQLAEKEFFKLKMNATKDKTGILIFLLLGEKNFYILADSGINDKVGQKTWDEVRDRLQESFKNGTFSAGLINAICEMGEVLAENFPVKKDDTNELSNDVVVR